MKKYKIKVTKSSEITYEIVAPNEEQAKGIALGERRGDSRVLNTSNKTYVDVKQVS